MTETSPWEKIFSGHILEILTKARANDETATEAEFIAKMLELKPGSRVLDVPCGGGRHAMMLAEWGHQVTGIDISEPLIMQASQEAASRNLKMDFEVRDMRDLPWQSEFDGIYCFWESFGYFDDQGNEDFLRAVYGALKPGGKFLVDTHIMETILQGIRGRDWSRVGDSIVFEERKFDHIESRLTREWIIVKQGQTQTEMERKLLTFRMYSYRELCTLLTKIGFTKCEGYYPLRPIPFQYGAFRLNLVATK